MVKSGWNPLARSTQCSIRDALNELWIDSICIIIGLQNVPKKWFPELCALGPLVLFFLVILIDVELALRGPCLD